MYRDSPSSGGDLSQQERDAGELPLHAEEGSGGFGGSQERDARLNEHRECHSDGLQLQQVCCEEEEGDSGGEDDYNPGFLLYYHVVAVRRVLLSRVHAK